jgi:hypothetical protein
MPYVPKFSVTMAKAGGKHEALFANDIADITCIELVNNIAKALGIAGYRGAVEFIFYKGTDVNARTIVTYSDDFPKGYFDNVREY